MNATPEALAAAQAFRPEIPPWLPTKTRTNNLPAWDAGQKRQGPTSIWRFPWGYPKMVGLNGKIHENLIKMDDLGVPLF